ncbi:hypothetical protein OPT61_g4562 [Boeremia exigua]|uniref:Uncharacterized protein n=1 Tax=Boeremia exigua TaxID=749465 RepID=A0ACC2IDQ9_9PLEO|nr:hypothetical protein OPT61_g4562 [Boeremia exigua]
MGPTRSEHSKEPFKSINRIVALVNLSSNPSLNQRSPLASAVLTAGTWLETAHLRAAHRRHPSSAFQGHVEVSPLSVDPLNISMRSCDRGNRGDGPQFLTVCAADETHRNAAPSSGRERRKATPVQLY